MQESSYTLFRTCGTRAETRVSRRSYATACCDRVRTSRCACARGAHMVSAASERPKHAAHCFPNTRKTRCAAHRAGVRKHQVSTTDSHCVLLRGWGARRVANHHVAHLARTRAQLRRMRTNTLQRRPITMNDERCTPRNRAHAKVGLCQRVAFQTRPSRPCARTGGCVLCAPSPTARVFHTCSFVTRRAHSWRRGRLRCCEPLVFFACSGRRAVVAKSPRTRVFSRVTRRKNTACAQQLHVASPTRQNTRPQRCWRLGENTCFPRPDGVSSCFSQCVSRV